MSNLFVEKLSSFEKLSANDKRVLSEICSDMRVLPDHTALIGEGQTPECAHAVLKGFACRYKLLRSGRRQIVDFLVPGDLCDGHALFRATMDHGIETLSTCQIAYIPHHTLIKVTDHHPNITRALWWSSLAQESVAREWIANVGARPADQRLAHLLCELCLRLAAVGLTHDDCYELPITQGEFADALGLSSVHINRMLQKLRQQKLIVLVGGVLRVRDLKALQHYCGFEGTYLHLLRDRKS